MSDGSDDNARTSRLPGASLQEALRRRRNGNDSGSGDNNPQPKHRRHILLWIVVIYLLVANAANAYNGNQLVAEIDRQGGAKGLPEFSYLPLIGLVGDLFGLAFSSVQNFLIFTLSILVIGLVIAYVRKNKSDNGAHS